MWQPRRLTTLWASTARYRDSFTFFHFSLAGNPGNFEAILTYKHTVTCLRHAAIVETQKPVNTLRNNRGSGVFSVPCRAEPHRALLHNRPRWRHKAPRSFPRQLRCKHGDDATVLLVNPLLDNMTWRDLTQQSWMAPFFVSLFLAI
jgi:hypothetical protein